MIVTPENFTEVMQALDKCEWLALDTETTGLKPYHGDRIFSIVIASSPEAAYYFNFNQYEDQEPLSGDYGLAVKHFLEKPRKWFMHNAKFDMHMLLQSGTRLSGTIHDTMIIGRLLNNIGMSFSLDTLLKEIGLEKDDAVKKYIDETPECHTVTKSLYRGAREKLLHYQLVPFEIMQAYAEKDACGTFALGVYQRKQIIDLHKQTPPKEPTIATAYKIECDLLPVVVDMEAVGVQLDEDFCKRAADYEARMEKAAQEEFQKLTGKDYVNSRKTFEPIFSGREEITLTEKGNAQFSSEILEKYTAPEAALILKARSHKASSAFYLGFLDFASKGGVIHANFNQTGTTTGRFSSSNPNLQNLTKEEGAELEQEFTVRRAFVPREGYFFAMLDYEQMEYRLMLDAAGETDLIGKVLGGLDVHQATADAAGISRRDAKTVNFGILYGQGKNALAKSLGISVADAEGIKSRVLDAAPQVKKWIADTIDRARWKGRTIKNWCGFMLKYPTYTIKTPPGEKLIDPSYKAPNGWVQGGCAYVAKIAMIKIHEYLRDKRSRIVMMIHDEIIVEVHKEEVYTLKKIQEIMETAYPHKYLPLTVGLEHSFRSLADRVDGCPSQS